jgi:hypothetical protein
MEVKDRERKVDVNSLSITQADALSVQIGKEIAKIMDEANLKCNELLKIYSLETSIAYKITKIGAKTRKKAKSKDLAKT